MNKEIKKAEEEWNIEIDKVSYLEDIFLEEYEKQMRILKQKLSEVNRNIKPYVFMEMKIVTNQTKRVLNINEL